MSTTDARNRVAMENDGSRTDARAKVTGAAKYTADINLPNMMWARYIRAPFANAKLKSANKDAAKAIKGVVDVEITLAPDAPALYSGQSVGYVCADSPQLMLDAIAALKMEWEVVNPPDISIRKLAGDVPADETLKEIFANTANKTIEFEMETQAQHHSALEPHCCVVEMKGDKAMVWGSTQATAGFRDGLTADLGIARENIEVNCEYVGGGFGAKLGGPGIEGKLAAQMAKKFNRPCKVVNNRKEEATDTGMRPGTLQYYKMAIDDKGKILGTRINNFGGAGAGRPQGGGANQVSYNLGQTAKTTKDVSLSTCAARPQRAPGWPQGGFALETAMDLAAAKAGLDPIAFRKLNESKPVRVAAYDIAAKEIGWDRRKPDGQWAGKLKRGFGVGGSEWRNAGFSPNTIEIRIFRDGKVEVLSGTQDIGTGTKTMLVDLAAWQMGLDRKFITGKTGSTNYPPGPGSGGSTVARSIAPSTMAAADKAAVAINELAATKLGVDKASLQVKGDSIVSKTDPTKKISWPDACKLIAGGADFISFTGTQNDSADYRGGGDSEGCCMAEVEVDTETGVVRLIKIVTLQCVGMPVNRKTVESQINGGTIQGIGFALFEERILNAVNGAPVNPNMEWYKLPGPADMPELVPIIYVPEGYTGVRGAGEPPMAGIPGAIANAVANAIGIHIRSLPITPEKVLTALKEKEGGVA